MSRRISSIFADRRDSNPKIILSQFGVPNYELSQSNHCSTVYIGISSMPIFPLVIKYCTVD